MGKRDVPLDLARGVIDRALGRIDLPLVGMVIGWATATVWAASLLSTRVAGLTAPPYDLAFFQQIVWNVGQSGQWVSNFHQGSFLGLHFSPILVVPALFERLVWPDVRVLTSIHAITVGAFIPAAFLFLRAGLRPSRFAGAIAAALAIPIPIWGAVQDVIRSDFHPEVSGVVLALFAGWAGLTGRPRVLWALAAVALLTREDVAYAVFIVGLVTAVRGPRRMRRHGRWLAIVAVAWAIVVFGVLMPAIRDGNPSETASYYAWLGEGWNVLAAPFAKAGAVVAAVTRPAAWFVVGGMIVSLGALPLLRPRWLALTLAPLVAVLLSAHVFQATLRLQYPAILIVPLLASAMFGGRRVLAVGTRHLARHGPRSPIRSTRWSAVTALGLSAALALPAVTGAWIQGSIPPFDAGDPAFRSSPAAIDALLTLARRVPDGALLAADEGSIAPLAGRASVGRLVVGSGPPQEAFVLLDRNAWAPTSAIARIHDEIRAELSTGARPVIADDGRFILWGPEPPSNP